MSAPLVAHRLSRVDRPSGPIRRAWCVCGEHADVGSYVLALEWMERHQEWPTMSPAELASLAPQVFTEVKSDGSADVRIGLDIASSIYSRGRHAPGSHQRVHAVPMITERWQEREEQRASLCGMMPLTDDQRWGRGRWRWTDERVDCVACLRFIERAQQQG